MFDRAQRAIILAVLCVTMGMAGCASDSSQTEDEGGPGEEQAQQATTPTWRIGNLWTFQIDTQNFPTTTTDMIVYNETADLYRLGITEEKQALVHALFDVNPFLGRLQKGNIGVFEDGRPRAMYDFPLEDGKTWETEIFVSQHGGTLTADATYNEAIDTQIGELPGYEIVASNDNGFTVEYNFVPQVKWLTTLEVTKADGTTVVDMELENFEENGTGTGYFVRGRSLGEFSYGTNECGPPSGCTDTVLVDGTQSERGGKGGRPFDIVAYNVQVNITDPENDRADIQISDGEGNTIYDRSLTESQQSEFKFEAVKQENFEPGDWQIDVTTTGEASASVRLAGGFSFQGTVE
jgi:hypothetical protein